MLRAELPNRVFETSPRWLSAKLLRARGHSLAIYHQGEWKNDQPKLTTANGDTYEGQWMENKARARARARAPDDARPGQRARHAHERRASCVLSHLRAQYHGTGRFTKANGDTYMGECIKGRAHGRGVLAYSTGEKYRGEFAHNQVLLRCPRVARGHRVCVS